MDGQQYIFKNTLFFTSDKKILLIRTSGSWFLFLYHLTMIKYYTMNSKIQVNTVYSIHSYRYRPLWFYIWTMGTAALIKSVILPPVISFPLQSTFSTAKHCLPEAQNTAYYSPKATDTIQQSSLSSLHSTKHITQFTICLMLCCFFAYNQLLACETFQVSFNYSLYTTFYDIS